MGPRHGFLDQVGAHVPTRKLRLERAQVQTLIESGPLTATARGKKASLAADFTVHPTPLLTTVPKEVGAPGELKVSGKHLDAVTTWRLGQVTLTPVAAATASKVTLTIPADAPVDQPLIAVTQGREFASKKPVATVKTPIVRGLAYWTGPEGKGVEGVIRGADFSDKTKFTLAGKPLKTSFVAADRVGFTLAKAPAAGAHKLSAKAGKYAGEIAAADRRLRRYLDTQAGVGNLDPSLRDDALVLYGNEGTRSDAVCNGSFQCATQTGVADDSGCGSLTTANTCGFFPSVSCNGAAERA